jgi:hypothetical protein
MNRQSSTTPMAPLVFEALVSAALSLYPRLDELAEAAWYAAMQAQDESAGRKEWARLVAEHFFSALR